MQKGKTFHGYHALKTTDTAHSRHLDKQLIAASFKASAATYEDNATVQRQISRRLITFLKDLESIHASRILEIGCCTGILTELLVGQLHIDTLYLNDIVEEFCITTGERIARSVARVESLPGDIEKCALPEELDMVISSATFQWMADLPALFAKIHRVLRPNGYLVFSILGPGTMGEISHLTGRSLPYHSKNTLRQMLGDYFHIISLQNDIRQIYFPSVREVLLHIRHTGVGGLDRNKWLPGKFKEFNRQYRSCFASESGFPVTYASIFVVAEKK